MNLKKAKIENIKTLLNSLGEIYSKMEDSPLKREYRRFLYLMQSEKADFKLVLIYLDKRIEMYEKAMNMMKGIDNKGIVVFWKNIKSKVVETYTENKEIDRRIDV